MEDEFYKDGLRFECTRCSRCCRHDPGYVFLTLEDIKTLAKELGLNRENFLKKYCKNIDIGGFSRISLKEKSNNDCILWDNDGCSVYKARPLQCKTYPFWSSVLNSREDWDTLGKSCPGVNQGKLHSLKEINKKIELRKKEPLAEGSPILKPVFNKK